MDANKKRQKILHLWKTEKSHGKTKPKPVYPDSHHIHPAHIFQEVLYPAHFM